MSRFVRCIEGHVFDAEVSGQCPTCGAIVEVPTPAAPAAPTGTVQRGVSAHSPAVGNASKRVPLLAAAAVVVLGSGIGALVFALHAGKPVTSPVGTPVSTASPAAKPGIETKPSAAPPAPASPQTNNAAPAVSPESQSSSSTPAAPGVEVSDALKTVLDVVRMLAAFGKSNYTDATSLANTLSNDNNPIGMFIKAGLFMDGLGGQPRDLAQARSLLARAAELGDPTSALFYGRVLENGIGGPRDPNGAKAAYLFAARSMAPGADQDLARLHLEGLRGMTVLDAYHGMLNDNSPDGLKVINELTQLHSTPAECLYGWLLHQAKDKGWVLSETGDRGAFVIKPAEMNAARAAAQNIPDDAIEQAQLRLFEYGARRSDPWCEWGMATLAAAGASGYPKNLVEADVFYRLVAMHKTLGSSVTEVNQELAAVQGKMTPAEKASADDLFHGAVPAGMAP